MSPQARRRILGWHRWLGQWLSVLLLMVCATGTLAVLGHEIDWVLDPAHRAQSAPMNWQGAHAALRARLPDHQIDSIRSPIGAGHAAIASVVSPSGQALRVLLDPGSGAVQGVRHLMSAQVYLRQLHKSLLMPKGLYVIGLLGVLLLFWLVSGIIAYPTWRKHWRRLRLKAKPTVRWSDIHRTGGIWVGLFAIVIGVTSVWYWVETVGRDTHTLPTAHERHPHRGAETPIAPLPDDAAAWVAAAEAALPSLHVRSVFFPGAPDDPVRVDGRIGTSLQRDRANRVYLDPADRAVLEVRTNAASGLYVNWTDLADDLHFGTLGDVGGLWSKILYFVLGCLLCVVVIAGPTLMRRRAEARKSDAPPRMRWRGRVGAVLIAGVTVLFILGVPAFTWLGKSHPVLTGRGTPTAVSAPAQLLGAPFVVEAHRFGARATYVVRWATDPPATLRALAVEAGAKPRTLHGLRYAEGTTTWLARPTIVATDGAGVAHRVAVTIDQPAAAPTTVAPMARAWWFIGVMVGGLFLLAVFSARWAWRRPRRLGRG